MLPDILSTQAFSTIHVVVVESIAFRAYKPIATAILHLVKFGINFVYFLF